MLINPIVFDQHISRWKDNSGHRALQSGDPVLNGDRLEAFVTANQDVYLYLGYCDGHEFKLFPAREEAVVRAEAKRETKIPPGEGAYRIDSDSKSEVLYLILSTQKLSPASSDLAVTLATKSKAVDGDCVEPMRDSAGKAIPRGGPGKARPAASSIEVVRYEFKHPVPAGPPGKPNSP